MITLGYAEHTGRGIVLKRLADGKPLADDARIHGFLASRLDFDVHILSIPRVADAEVEGCIRYRLRSIYPGSPADTAFDYRLESGAAQHSAVIFLARKGRLEEHKVAAKQRPLYLPYVLIQGIGKARRDVRICFCQKRWAELSTFQGGFLTSCTVLKREKAAFGLGRIAESSDGPTGTLPLIIVASAEEVDLFSREVAGGSDRDGQAHHAIEFLSYRELESTLRRVNGLFGEHRRRRSPFTPMARIAALAAVVVILGSLVFQKRVRMAEEEVMRLKAASSELEQQARKIGALQAETDSYGAELSRMGSAKPQDLYVFLSELTGVLGGTVRIQNLRVQGDSFHIEAVGSNPLKIMEGFRNSAVFDDAKLAQVIPEARSGKERFSFSGTLHAR